jgi:hypothetical protein
MSDNVFNIRILCYWVVIYLTKISDFCKCDLYTQRSCVYQWGQHLAFNIFYFIHS